MSQVGSTRQRRINMRVSERQKRALRAAAEVSGESWTAFVLGVATERAEEACECAQRIDLCVARV